MTYWHEHAIAQEVAAMAVVVQLGAKIVLTS